MGTFNWNATHENVGYVWNQKPALRQRTPAQAALHARHRIRRSFKRGATGPERDDPPALAKMTSALGLG